MLWLVCCNLHCQGLAVLHGWAQQARSVEYRVYACVFWGFAAVQLALLYVYAGLLEMYVATRHDACGVAGCEQHAVGRLGAAVYLLRLTKLSGLVSCLSDLSCHAWQAYVVATVVLYLRYVVFCVLSLFPHCCSGQYSAWTSCMDVHGVAALPHQRLSQWLSQVHQAAAV